MVRTLVCSACAALVVALSACATVRTTEPGAIGVERRALMLVPSSSINASASQAYRQILAEESARGTLNTDAALTARVRTVAERLIPQARTFRDDAPDWEWEVNVISSSTLNAWCMPGGKIAFYTGIIQTLDLDDAEIAAIMGHEIAHALREHGRERVSENLMLNFGLKAAALATKANTTAINLAGEVTKYTFVLPNSREHETEADRVGIELAARAGYDPRAAIRVWEKMQAHSGRQPPEWQSTHPSHQTRIADLSEQVQKVMHLYEESTRR
jgi:predicted Zn-dependent protease